MNKEKYTLGLIEEFKRKAGSTLKETKKLFSELKQLPSAKVDQAFHSAHEQVFDQVDCMQCANCCKTISPIITQKDISTISSALRIPASLFLQKYLEMDEDGDFVFSQTPCPFLQQDNSCGIYSHRPQACRDYPHTNRKRMKQILDLTLQNTQACPAVWKIVESIKHSYSRVIQK